MDGMTPGINPHAAALRTPGPPDRGGLSGQLQALKNQMPPNEWEQFKAEMQSLPPEEMAARIAALATDYGIAADDATADMSRADALRQDAPRGRYAGGMYIAANPLEHVAQVMHNRKLDEDYTQGRTARDAARTGATGVRESAMARLLRQ